MDRTVAGPARNRLNASTLWPTVSTDVTCLCRHEQLKQEEKTMEDQIKVNAEAVESLIRILSK